MSKLMIDEDGDLFLVCGKKSTLIKINDIENRMTPTERCVDIGTKIKTEYLKNLREVEIVSVAVSEPISEYPKVMRKVERNLRPEIDIIAYVTDSEHGVVIKPNYLAGTDIIITNIDEWSEILNDTFVGNNDEVC